MRIENCNSAVTLAEMLSRQPLEELLDQAEAMTLDAFGATVTYSPKVFIPLTHLCRDVCHYCTFAKAPRTVGTPYLTLDRVLEIARAGEAAGCREALFTLGDRPEDRYAAARAALDGLGHASTVSYLREAAAAVLAQTSLLPHLNPGILAETEIVALRPVAVSMGLMVESSAERLSAKGGASAT